MLRARWARPRGPLPGPRTAEQSGRDPGQVRGVAAPRQAASCALASRPRCRRPLGPVPTAGRACEACEASGWCSQASRPTCSRHSFSVRLTSRHKGESALHHCQFILTGRSAGGRAGTPGRPLSPVPAGPSPPSSSRHQGLCRPPPPPPPEVSQTRGSESERPQTGDGPACADETGKGGGASLSPPPPTPCASSPSSRGSEEGTSPGPAGGPRGPGWELPHGTCFPLHPPPRIHSRSPLVLKTLKMKHSFIIFSLPGKKLKLANRRQGRDDSQERTD